MHRRAAGAPGDRSPSSGRPVRQPPPEGPRSRIARLAVEIDASCRLRDGRTATASVALKHWPKSRRVYAYLRYWVDGRTVVAYIGDVTPPPEAGGMTPPRQFVVERCERRRRPRSGEAWEAWIDAARRGEIRNRNRRAYKPSALRSYDNDMKLYVLSGYGARRLADIRVDDLQHLIDRLVGTGLSGSRVRNVVVPLQALYRRHRREVPVNPTRDLDLPKPGASGSGMARPPMPTRRSPRSPAREGALGDCLLRRPPPRRAARTPCERRSRPGGGQRGLHRCRPQLG